MIAGSCNVKLSVGSRFVTVQTSKGQFFASTDEAGLPEEPDKSIAQACGTVFNTKSWREVLTDVGKVDEEGVPEGFVNVARKYMSGAPDDVVIVVAKFVFDSCVAAAEVLFDSGSGSEGGKKDGTLSDG